VGRKFPDLAIVGVAAGNGRGEDRGVRRDTGNPVLVDQALQFAAFDQGAREVVEPDRLAVLLELPKGIATCHGDSVILLTCR
jgi:hypothetical protein